MTFLGLLLAVFMSLALGLLGGGGSMLAVPLLVYTLGSGTKEAVAASLAIAGLSSLFGDAEHWREGCVRLRVALVLGALAAAGAYLGAHLAGFLSAAAQLSLFAVVMLVAAFFMSRNNEPDGIARTISPTAPRYGCFSGLPRRDWGSRVLTGLVDAGGEFLIVVYENRGGVFMSQSHA